MDILNAPHTCRLTALFFRGRTSSCDPGAGNGNRTMNDGLVPHHRGIDREVANQWVWAMVRENRQPEALCRCACRSWKALEEVTTFSAEMPGPVMAMVSTTQRSSIP